MPYIDKEKKNARARVYRATHKEEIGIYRKANKKKNRGYSKTWREANKGKKSVENRSYYEVHKEEIIARLKAYREANKEKIKARSETAANKEKRRARARQRQKSDPVFRMTRNIRKRLSRVIKNKNGSRWFDFIGCTAEQLKTHLEAQFQSGMSWNNYGEWHVDHKFPLSVAAKVSEEELKKACHYSNLQPLWAIDNMKKGTKV